MGKHSTDSAMCVDDWEARAKISEALAQLVDEAEMTAETDVPAMEWGHSTGVIDREAELEALTEWFGIE